MCAIELENKIQKGQSLTQRELAEKLGVSQMTISRAINDQPGISLELKRKILEVLKKYDYVPDNFAMGLRTKTTQVVGLVIPDVSDSFFPEITKSIEINACKKGYSIILAHSHESYDEDCRVINLLRGYRVCGFIIAPAGDENEIGVYRKLQDLRIPFVFIDRSKKSIDCSYVGTDVEKGAFELGRHLIKKGYRNWGYLRGPKGISSSEAHFRGLEKSICESSRSAIKMRIELAGFAEEDGYRAVQILLKKGRPDVIVAVNDAVAAGVLRFLKTQRIVVPKDVALAGFSDLKHADLFESPLTTVREHTSEIGRLAIDILLEEIEHSSQKKQKKLICPELVVRGSA